MDINIDDNVMRLINCYLPYDNGENDAEYIDYLAKIHDLMDDHPNNNVLVIGDFNAHPQSRFGNELLGFSNDFGYIVGDINSLPNDTYTWISDASGHTRWLDHLLCPVSLMPRLVNMYIDHNIVGSDHRPLCVTIANTTVPPLVTPNVINRTSYVVRNKNVYMQKTETNLKNVPLP